MSDDNPFSMQKEPLMHEAWAWLEDCGILDSDEHYDLVMIGRITASDIIMLVQRHYDGGWAQFLQDTDVLEQWVPVLEKRDSHNMLRGITEQNNITGKRRYRAVPL